MFSRRQWLFSTGVLFGASRLSGAAQNTEQAGSGPTGMSDKPSPLPLTEYEPKSMLQVRETHVARCRFPAIDIHTHISFSKKAENGVQLAPEREYLGTPQECLAVMERKNIRAMVNLTGGFDAGLADAVSKYDKAFPSRFFTFAEPSYPRFKEQNYPQIQADAIAG